jgi:hypothetical protein
MKLLLAACLAGNQQSSQEVNNIHVQFPFTFTNNDFSKEKTARCLAALVTIIFDCSILRRCVSRLLLDLYYFALSALLRLQIQ